MELDCGAVVVKRRRALVYHGRNKVLRVDPLGQLLQILSRGDGGGAYVGRQRLKAIADKEKMAQKRGTPFLFVLQTTLRASPTKAKAPSFPGNASKLHNISIGILLWLTTKATSLQAPFVP